MENQDIDQIEYKAQHQQQVKQIRRAFRDQIFSKRRNLLPQDEPQSPQELSETTTHKERVLIVDDRYRTQIESFLRNSYRKENLPELIAAIDDEDIINQHYGMIGIRKTLSVAENSPIQEIIDAGLIPRMVGYARQDEYPQLQLEATWALTNIASGTTEQCLSIIDEGGIPLLMQLLKNNNPGILEQAIWAIGNIASDCVFHRDTVNKAGGIVRLVEVVNRVEEKNLIKHACWALSNLCRGNPLPKYEAVKAAIPVLCEVIATEKLVHRQTLTDCYWALSYHSDGLKKKIQVIVDSKVIPKIIKNLEDKDLAILVPSIRILGNVSTGSAEHTNQLLAGGILERLEKVLHYHKKVVRRQACWVISNFSAGTKTQAEAVYLNESLMKRLFDLFQTDSDDVRREICYIFSNLTHAGDPIQIFQLYKQTNIISYYVELLKSQDSKTIETSLFCLYIVLSHGEKFKDNKANPLVLDLRNTCGVQLLEQLQYHQSDMVYKNLVKILQDFFEVHGPVDPQDV